MKKIINRKKYDTETATQIADYWNGLSKSDFNIVYEILYRKRNNEFFLYYEGYGAMGSFEKNIKPLSEEEVKDWLEKREISASVYEELFGEIEE